MKLSYTERCFLQYVLKEEIKKTAATIKEMVNAVICCENSGEGLPQLSEHYSDTVSLFAKLQV